MRCWGVVQAGLRHHARTRDQRMRVMRIATTDDPPQRLVGMLVPEVAVEEVVRRLTEQEQREREAAEAAACSAGGSKGADAGTGGGGGGGGGGSGSREGRGRGRPRKEGSSAVQTK